MGGLGFGFQCCSCILLNIQQWHQSAVNELWEPLRGTWTFPDAVVCNGAGGVLAYKGDFGSDFYLELTHVLTAGHTYRILVGVEDADNWYAFEVGVGSECGIPDGHCSIIQCVDGEEQELDRINCVINPLTNGFWGSWQNWIRIWSDNRDMDDTSTVYFCWYNHLSTEGYRKMSVEVPADVVGLIGIGTGGITQGATSSQRIFGTLTVRQNSYKCDSCHPFDFRTYTDPPIEELFPSANYQVTIAGVPADCHFHQSQPTLYGNFNGDYFCDHYLAGGCYNNTWWTWKEGVGHCAVGITPVPDTNKIIIAASFMLSSKWCGVLDCLYSYGTWRDVFDLDSIDLSNLDVTLPYYGNGDTPYIPYGCEGVQSSTAHVTSA